MGLFVLFVYGFSTYAFYSPDADGDAFSTDAFSRDGFADAFSTDADADADAVSAILASAISAILADVAAVSNEYASRWTAISRATFGR